MASPGFFTTAASRGPRLPWKIAETPAAARRILVVAVTPGSLTPHSMVKNGFLTWEARYGALRHDCFARRSVSFRAGTDTRQILGLFFCAGNDPRKGPVSGWLDL